MVRRGRTVLDEVTGPEPSSERAARTEPAKVSTLEPQDGKLYCVPRAAISVGIGGCAAASLGARIGCPRDLGLGAAVRGTRTAVSSLRVTWLGRRVHFSPSNCNANMTITATAQNRPTAMMATKNTMAMALESWVSDPA